MRRIVNDNNTFKSSLKVAKRIATTILCCLPIILVFAYLTRNIITSNVVQIICFMTIMGTVLLIVLILFVREEILSYGCRRDIERAREAYLLSQKELLKEQEEDGLALGGPMCEGYLPAGAENDQECTESLYKAA